MPFAPHESAIEQAGKMIGCVGLAQPRRINDLANGERPIPERRENAEARWIAQATEELGAERMVRRM